MAQRPNRGCLGLKVTDEGSAVVNRPAGGLLQQAGPNGRRQNTARFGQADHLRDLEELRGGRHDRIDCEL
jgi:hypothetical protein